MNLDGLLRFQLKLDWNKPFHGYAQKKLDAPIEIRPLK
jgi:hypothetical protein